MPTNTITLVPGVNAEFTPSLNQAAYQSTNLIRFMPSGLPQKLGGWTRFYPSTIDSIVRALHPWEDLSGVLHLGVGATSSLDVITEGALSNITPQLNVTNSAVNFSTTMDSNIVVINDTGSDTSVYDTVILQTQISIDGLILFGAYPVSVTLSADSYEIIAAGNAVAGVTDGGAVPQFTSISGTSAITVVLNDHGLSVGSTFPVVVPTVIAGLTLSGFYTVNSVSDANTFIINAANQANASTTVSMNGGNAQIDYYIAIGPLQLATGFGIGGFGEGGFGTGQAIPAGQGTPITAIDYTLDNWGGFLVACPDDGPIFVWQPESGVINAQMISQAPVASTGIFVAMPAQILVAYGSAVLGIQDPLLINWSNAGDYTVWIASVTNQAGEFRIPRGSAIIGGMQGPQYALIWTDLAVWSMSYIGAPLVFSFNELASGCGLIAKFAAVTLGTTVYWMSQKGFFALPSGGSVVPLPCSVWDVIFQDLNASPANILKIRAAANSQFQEVTWYFPSANGNGENDTYVKFSPSLNAGAGAWDYGSLGRSAWYDQSVLGPPLGADPTTNLIYQHETSMDADGQPINASFTTGFWALADGQDMMFVDQCYPDMKFGYFGGAQSANVQVTFSYAYYAQSTVYNTPTYTMTSGGLNFLNPRFRGRLASMTVSSDDLGSWWRLGGLRMRTAPDGRL